MRAETWSLRCDSTSMFREPKTRFARLRTNGRSSVAFHASSTSVVGWWTAFPFAIVYVELDTEVLILAVAHGKRRPGYWRERVPPPRT
jgi:hypothetical protein